jgi:predicted TIM-barrel fold metal-dependent hydrolase
LSSTQIRKRVLFGTDYDVVSLGSFLEAERPGGQPLDFYLSKYLKVFGEWLDHDQLRRQLEFENPEAFFRFND